MPTPDLEVLAVVSADWHASHVRPKNRTDDWYASMHNNYSQVIDIANKHDAPILISGDLLHKWNAPPELTNFLIKIFRRAESPVYTIVGQHDLPYHDPGQLHKSAYWTLVESEVIEDLGARVTHIRRRLVVHAFPYGFNILPCNQPKAGGDIHVALCHQYIWMDKKTAYPHAPQESRVNSNPGLIDQFRGYNAAFFGDNHIPFTFQFLFNDVIEGAKKETYRKYACTVVNCGSLVRRNIDQLKHRPAVYLLYANGDVVPQSLNIEGEHFTLEPPTASAALGYQLAGFLESLKGKTKTLGDFPAVVRQWIEREQPAPEVETLLLEILEESET